MPFDLFAGARDMAYSLTLSAGRPVVVGSAQEVFDAASRWAILRGENDLILADDFERGDATAWSGN